MEYYSGNNKPYIYTLFSFQQEAEIEKYLEGLLSTGASFCRGYTLSKDEKKRIEGAHAVLLFVTKDIIEDPQFREAVDYAIGSGKNILTVYLEKIKADAWVHMQLFSAQAVFRYDFDNDEALIEKLKEAEIFRDMKVTPQQKKFKRRATISTWISILIIFGFIYLIASSPRIISIVEQKMVDTSVKGLEGMTQKDLDEITELYIVGKNVYVGHDQNPFQYDHGKRHIKYDERGNISDLSEITKCHNLRKLTIAGNNITDISPITTMKQLYVLNLNDNPIESIEGIENLTELRALSLENTDVKDLSPIAHLDKLESLDIMDTPVSELPDTGLVEHLKSLEIRDTNITSVPYLGTGEMDHLGLSVLEKKDGYLNFLKDKESFDLLNFCQTDLDDVVEALQGKTVQDFDDAGIEIHSIRELEPLSEIVEHNLCLTSHNNLTDLDGIEAFDGIKFCSINECDNLTDITALLNLHSLEGLYLESSMKPLVEEQLQGRFKNIIYDWDE